MTASHAQTLNPHRVPGTVRWLARRTVVLLTQALVGFSARIGKGRGTSHPTSICIESGVIGFTLLDVQEIERSAIEHFGADYVTRSLVEERHRYLRNARRAVAETRPKYYWVDPRSGSQRPVRGVLQSVGMAILLARYGVIPIVWLTDAPHRRWRLQAEVLTAGSGLAFTLESPSAGPIRFAHKRFLGPSPMPLSISTLDRLAATAQDRPGDSVTAVFVGSLYEPRTSTVLRIQSALAERGYVLEIHARQMDGPRVSDDEYWRRLMKADAIFTTASHATDPSEDYVDSPHLIYRYTESLAAGTALVAPLIREADHLYEPNVHYAAYETEDEAIELLAELLENADFRARMGEAGRRRVRQLMMESSVWSLVDQLAE